MGGGSWGGSEGTELKVVSGKGGSDVGVVEGGEGGVVSNSVKEIIGGEEGRDKPE